MGAAGLNLANASAASTTAGAPTPLSVGPQQAPAPAGSNQPPIGASQRHPVAPHAGQPSVGTHKSLNPAKRTDPVHGHSQDRPIFGGK